MTAEARPPQGDSGPSDPIARVAKGMADALRERCPGCKGHLKIEERPDGAWHRVSEDERFQCRLYTDERKALMAYDAATTKETR